MGVTVGHACRNAPGPVQGCSGLRQRHKGKPQADFQVCCIMLTAKHRTLSLNLNEEPCCYRAFFIERIFAVKAARLLIMLGICLFSFDWIIDSLSKRYLCLPNLHCPCETVVRLCTRCTGCNWRRTFRWRRRTLPGDSSSIDSSLSFRTHAPCLTWGCVPVSCVLLKCCSRCPFSLRLSCMNQLGLGLMEVVQDWADVIRHRVTCSRSVNI